MRPSFHLAYLSLLLCWLAACTPSSTDETGTLVIPTSASPAGALSAATAPVLQPAVVNTPTLSSEQVVATEPATPEPPEVVQEQELGYQVVFVEADDVLNVRAEAGADQEIVAELAPDAAGVSIVGPGQLVADSTWVPISAGSRTGWVNSRFLSQVVAGDRFCENQAVQTLLADLQQAVAEENGELLSQLVHPERGLRLHHSWWNPVVLVRGDEMAGIFESEEVYDWGREDGSGKPIVGSFAEVLMPLLRQDLLSSAESACNEILQGGTAGIVRVPDGYQAVEFYSFYRPGTEANGGLDWGSWVVGVEKWQGRYYLSYLLHFAWEI